MGLRSYPKLCQAVLGSSFIQGPAGLATRSSAQLTGEGFTMAIDQCEALVAGRTVVVPSPGTL